MRPRRDGKKAEFAQAVSRSSEAASTFDHGRDLRVDSRAYAFAYLLTEPSQLPADFPFDEDFEYGLFLPQELVPRFETPRFVARLLLQGPDHLWVYSHPSCGLGKVTIRFVDISHIELERFLADCSLIVFTPARVIHMPFHGRDLEYVEVFLDRLKRRLISGGEQLNPIFPLRDFGSRLDYKFEQIEAILNIDREAVVARFFVPPQEMIKPRLFRDELSWRFGSEIVLTRTELHLFSDDQDGYRQLYGFRAQWVPLQIVRDIKWDPTLGSITINLLNNLWLRVPAPEELRSEAQEFVAFACGQIQTRQTSERTESSSEC